MDETQAWRPEDTFGARLVLVRRELGLSQSEAAERCGISGATWATWELGRSPRNMPRQVDKISDALGVDRDWLMWGGQLATTGVPLDLRESLVARAPRSRCDAVGTQRPLPLPDFEDTVELPEYAWKILAGHEDRATADELEAVQSPNAVVDLTGSRALVA
jgi:transcriptional regulator with XRE-family HTH domain